MGYKCPICGKAVLLRQSGGGASDESCPVGFFPFCSERCKWVDVGGWLDARYRIEAEESPQQGGDVDDDQGD